MEKLNLIVSDKLFIPVANKPITPEVNAPSKEFSSNLNDAIEKIDNLQVNADVEVSKLSHGNGNIHETALAFEEADVALRLAVKVRNKAVEAYQEIMRIQV
jgi:flagellar hook-basal body complex protein FliE